MIFFWKDKKSVFRGCNKSFAKAAGLEPEHIIGKTDFDMPWKHHAEKYIRDDQEVMETNTPKLNYEEIQTQSTGKNIIALVSKVPLHDKQNDIIGILGIYTDITDRKLTEEREKEAIREAAIAKAKAEAEVEEELRNTILDFAGSMAHDQRSPIMIVKSIAKNYEKILPVLLNVYDHVKETLPKEMLLQNRYYEYMKSNDGINSLKDISEEMNIFIDSSLHNLKIVKNVHQGEISSDDFSTCEIYKCLQQIYDHYAIRSYELCLVHIDKRYKFSFKGNYVLANHIFSNLLVNTLYQIRKNKKGEIFISTEDGGTVNIVRFKDTAGGASPEIVKNMFKGYYTTKSDGTGIGLAFCERMMKIFGGSITAHSVEGDYMEFVLSFPKIHSDYVT